MSPYADNSFLVSCYVTDANTPGAWIYLARTGMPLIFTALHTLEVRNAFRLGVFCGLFSATEAAAAAANLDADIRGGRLIKQTVRWAVAYRLAASISE